MTKRSADLGDGLGEALIWEPAAERPHAVMVCSHGIQSYARWFEPLGEATRVGWFRDPRMTARMTYGYFGQTLSMRRAVDGEIAALDEKGRSSSGCDPTKRQRRSFVNKSHRSLQASAHLSAPKVARKLLSPPMKHYAVSHKKAQEGF